MFFAVYLNMEYKYGNAWDYSIMNRNNREIELPVKIKASYAESSLTEMAVSAVDRTGNESEKALKNLRVL